MSDSPVQSSGYANVPREMPEMLVAMMDALPARIALLDPTGMITWVNAAWRRGADGFQWPPDLAGEGVPYLSVCARLLTHKGSARAATLGLRQVLSGKAPQFTLEYPLTVGMESAWEVLTLIPLGNGKGSGAVATHTDITERRNAQETIREAQERFRLRTNRRAVTDAVLDGFGSRMNASRQVRADASLRRTEDLCRFLFDENPVPMWVFDLETLRFLEVNQSAVRHYGYSRGEFLARTVADIEATETPDSGLGASRTVPAGSAEDGERQRHKTRDGEVLHVEVTTRPIDFQGRAARLVLAQDVTERTAAQEKIAEQAALLNETSDALVLCDPDQRIRVWNRGAAQLYGWTEPEVLGSPVTKFLRPCAETFAKALEVLHAEGSWQGELRQTTKAGIRVLVLGRWTLLKNGEGRLLGVLATYTDITEKKRLETQFLRVQRLESIGTLAGGIAHDLNNVLAPIIMGMDLLKLSVSEPEGLEILSTVQSTARRGASLVRQVLAFARGLEGERVQLEVRNLVKDIERIILETFPKNIPLSLKAPPEGLIVLGEPRQLHQVLLNLCLNARDAMIETGGTLGIRVNAVFLDGKGATDALRARQGPHVMIAVSDTGCGIRAEIRDRIFEPFFTTKELGKGTGLGLATVLAIVKGHRGFVDVETAEGQGSTFTVYLPQVQAAAEPLKKTGAGSMPRGHGEWILLVEDEPSVRSVTQQALEAYGYKVLAAEDGAVAVLAYDLHRDKIRVVITDMLMPVMDGKATIAALRRINPDLKIIAASGLGPPKADDASTDPAEAPNCFLSKPYSAPALLGALHRLLIDR